jgi:hypothetical protein
MCSYQLDIYIRVYDELPGRDDTNLNCQKNGTVLLLPKQTFGGIAV